MRDYFTGILDNWQQCQRQREHRIKGNHLDDNSPVTIIALCITTLPQESSFGLLDIREIVERERERERERKRERERERERDSGEREGEREDRERDDRESWQPTMRERMSDRDIISTNQRTYHYSLLLLLLHPPPSSSAISSGWELPVITITERRTGDMRRRLNDDNHDNDDTQHSFN